MERPITVGSIVYSRAGRDEGRYYMVYEILDGSYVTIVDGEDKAPKKHRRGAGQHRR